LPERICTTSSPDGASQDATRRIQAAIDWCDSGAAVRLVPGPKGGRFFSGPLRMTSGVTLWLDRGVVLTALSDPRAYDRGQGVCGTIAAKGNGCTAFIRFDGTRGGGSSGTARSTVRAAFR
jgi:polygalacturonase